MGADAAAASSAILQSTQELLEILRETKNGLVPKHLQVARHVGPSIFTTLIDDRRDLN